MKIRGLLLVSAVAIAASGITYATAAGGGTASSFVPVAPIQLLDTRSTAPVAPIGANGTRSVQVTGVSSIPATATAANVSITALDGTTSSRLKVYPHGTTPPPSSLYWSGPSPVSTGITVALGSNGAFDLTNVAGTVNVIVVLNGYYVPAATGGTAAPAAVPVAKAYLKAPQSIPTGEGANFAALDTDYASTGMRSDAAPTKITITKAGVYTVTANCQWADSSAGGRYCAVAQDEALVLASSSGPVGGGVSTWQSATGTAELKVGDYLELYVIQTTGGPLDLEGGVDERTSLSVSWVGPNP